MPKYSRSRSRDSDHKSKKSHKHKDKDKKKHKKHSRSRDRSGKSSSLKKPDSPPASGGAKDYSRRDDGGSRKESSRGSTSTNGHFGSIGREEEKQGLGGREREKDRGGDEEIRNMQQQKKTSRFSDTPSAQSQSNQPPSQQLRPNQNQSSNMMPPPSNVQTGPVKKRKFIWTDADENELREQQLFEKRQNLDESHPALMIGSNPSLLQNLNPAILNALQDSSKIKKKIYLPKNTGINYIGLLIGPRGLYQKRLEEESGCKILIRGKGSQKEGSAPQPDDDDEQHVLIIGDSTESVRRAQNAIERVISADDTTRNKIREEQLVVAQQINNSIQPGQQMDDSMMTPYGPPSPYAYIIPVPNDCVGLIIGKGGDTIRQLQMESGAKIQVAKKEIPNSNLRNVFVEGPPEKYQKAKEMIEEIIREHRRTADPQIHVGDVNPFTGPHSKVKVPDKFVGLIIGKNGENLRGIAQRSNTKIFVPQKNNDPGAEERIVEVDGESQSVEIARQEIFALIQRYMSQSNSNTYDYQKNPYGSGIAVYNQQKLASDGQAINGAVPDSLKPESGSYASSLLTENPMLAYNAMQLTGWSYEAYPGQNANAYPAEGGQDGSQAPQQYGQDYDQSSYYYQQQYQGAPAGGHYPPYDQSSMGYNQDYNSYYQYPAGAYPQQPGSGGDQVEDKGAAVVPGQNPESTTQAQPSSTDEQQQQQQPPGYDQQAYDYQQYYQQYYNYYGQPPPAGDPATAAYYQQYYAGQQPPGGEEGNNALQQEQDQVNQAAVAQPTEGGESKQQPGQ